MMEQITLQEYMDIKQEIRNSMTKAVISFVEIGFNLKRIRDEKLYLQDGYKDIWEAAEAEFGLKRKQAWAFMNINDKYSLDGNSKQLLPQYEGFSKSALTEMLTLPEEDIDLITKDTKVEDIRELKQAEQTYMPEEQIEGQQSILDNYNEVVPEQDKQGEADLSEVLRELFRPKDMERYLNRLLNGEDIKIWTTDFYQNVEHTFSRMPYFIFFYEYNNGFKIKNIKTQQIEAHSYNDLWMLTLKAFTIEINQKEEHGGEVWDIAFGEEWREQQRIEKEKENKLKEAKKKKKEKQDKKNAESIDFTQCEANSKEPQKVQETTEIRSEKSEKESEQSKEEPKTPENAPDKIAEKPDFTPLEPELRVEERTEIVEGEVEDECMCDTAQNTIIIPVLPGEHIYLTCIVGADDNMQPIYGVHTTSVYMYEYKNQRTIEMRYYNRKNDSAVCTIPVNGEYEQILHDEGIFLTKEEAERRCEELNAKEQEVQSDGV